MPIPDFQTLMLPVLKAFGDGCEKEPEQIRGPIAAEFQVLPEELAIRLPSGQTTFNNRVAWALSYLKRAQLIESPSRGLYRLTARGTDLLKTPPHRLDVKYL